MALIINIIIFIKGLILDQIQKKSAMSRLFFVSEWRALRFEPTRSWFDHKRQADESMPAAEAGRAEATLVIQ